jgi:uncharacterized membrane protein YsdA (DUF1294 family)
VFETVLYLVAINAAAFGAFAYDKRAAARARPRVREQTLFALAAIGGSPGALIARQVLRHKNRKAGFGGTLWLIAGAQAALLAYLARVDI